MPGLFLHHGCFLIVKGMRYFRLVPSTWVEHKRKFFDGIRNNAFCDTRLNKVYHELKKCHRLETLISPTAAEIRNIASRLKWYYF